MMQVKRVGMLCTLQDLGRFGQRYLGISVCGALDHLSMRLANILLENEENTLTLEITMGPCEFIFQRDAWIAIVGGDFSARIDNTPLPQGLRTKIYKGQQLHFSYPKFGARVYLAVDGGFKGDYYLGSASTDLKACFGGYKGRGLQEGDCIALGTARELKDLKQGLAFRNFRQKFRVMLAPEYAQFALHSQHDFWNQTWRVTQNSNRMGFRLEGAKPLERIVTDDLLSQGIVIGTIQVPPNGQPIILHQDAQVTGGYPRIGFVISADLPHLAQMRLGEKLSFEECSHEQALEALYLEHKLMEYYKYIIKNQT